MSRKVIEAAIALIQSRMGKAEHYVAEAARCREVLKDIDGGDHCVIRIQMGPAGVEVIGNGSASLSSAAESFIRQAVRKALSQSEDDHSVCAKRLEADALSMLSGAALRQAPEDGE